MTQFTLYTYASLTELRKLQEVKDVFPFIFAETMNILKEEPDSIIDITALIYILRVNQENLYTANINLREMTEDTKIIVEEALATEALSAFPHLFSIQESLFDICDTEADATSELSPYLRQPVYIYHNTNDLDKIIHYSNENSIPITTFSHVSGNINSEVEKFTQSTELALLDFTSVIYAIEDNKNLIYSVELFINHFRNLKVIVLTAQADRVFKYFPLYFDGHKPIHDILPALEDTLTTYEQDSDLKKITTLTDLEFSKFADAFSQNLIGHNNFKDCFFYNLKNFRALNMVKEQSVFSVFLFGASGIGKTEVARLLAAGLLPDSYLAKINFQNYSSQDALNSLIGSPAGYIGCEHGELGDKIKKSKIGVLLCDEFEKTTRQVFSFFLELLEEGKFTDSMAREYYLDGYVIIFTSNIKNEAEYKKVIPTELQTRFDLVCEFLEPSYIEKKEFLDLLLEHAQLKFVEKFSKIQMTMPEKAELYNFSYINIHALRDIKRVFNQRLMDYFTSKGV
ncbi:AAA family ATPase [Acetobacterium sp.]|uniref:AAA family ATPase n=1 Tax=Acetobacterium sp. TaxID=1872094 RepID=UPI002F429BA0